MVINILLNRKEIIKNHTHSIISKEKNESQTKKESKEEKRIAINIIFHSN